MLFSIHIALLEYSPLSIIEAARISPFIISFQITWSWLPIANSDRGCEWRNEKYEVSFRLPQLSEWLATFYTYAYTSSDIKRHWQKIVWEVNFMFNYILEELIVQITNPLVTLHFQMSIFRHHTFFIYIKGNIIIFVICFSVQLDAPTCRCAVLVVVAAAAFVAYQLQNAEERSTPKKQQQHSNQHPGNPSATTKLP